MNKNMPQHVAIIIDGNRRWAKENNKTNLQGHKKGFENIRKLAEYIFAKGVKYLSVFAFSTENFNRSAEEVKYLMDTFVTEFKKEYKRLITKDIKIVFSGRRHNLREDVCQAMDEATALSKDNNGGIFNICLNYGGHAEIIDASKKMIVDVQEGKLQLDEINEQTMTNYLYQPLPQIDLLIRTGSEFRVSNFMLWQLNYAEFYFPPILWPEFSKYNFDQAIIEYQKRNRHFGGDRK